MRAWVTRWSDANGLLAEVAVDSGHYVIRTWDRAWTPTAGTLREQRVSRDVAEAFDPDPQGLQGYRYRENPEVPRQRRLVGR